MERLDEEKIELLRRWGEGLEGDYREETRAAGRANEMAIRLSLGASRLQLVTQLLDLSHRALLYKIRNYKLE